MRPPSPPASGARARRRAPVAAVALACLCAWTAAAVAADRVSGDRPHMTMGPLNLTKTDDLDFGRLSVAGGGQAKIDPSGALTTTGGVMAQGGNPGAAAFAVSGDPGALYDITLPKRVDITDGTGNRMQIQKFTDSENGSGTLVGGTDTFTVGATLKIAPNQAPGVYTGYFDVTVAYQ